LNRSAALPVRTGIGLITIAIYYLFFAKLAKSFDHTTNLATISSKKTQK
jgi:hypothetical protein